MPQIHIVQSLQLGNKLSLFVTLLSLQPSFQHIPLLGHVHLGVVPGIPLASPACHLSQAPGLIEHQSADTAGMQTTDSSVNTRLDECGVTLYAYTSSGKYSGHLRFFSGGRDFKRS